MGTASPLLASGSAADDKTPSHIRPRPSVRRRVCCRARTTPVP
jgi:hypothetical protein